MSKRIPKSGRPRDLSKQTKIPLVTKRDFEILAYKRTIPFEVYMEMPEFKELTDHVVQYTRQFWYRQIVMMEIETEAMNTLMIPLLRDYELFVTGVLDRFPQTKEYYALTVWRTLIDKYCTQKSIQRHYIVASYNTCEYYDEETKMFPATSRHKANVNPCLFSEDDPFVNIPDMLNFWEFNFSVAQLAIMYNTTRAEVRKRINDCYDAMELNNEQPRRRRPTKWRKKWRRNYFLSKEYSDKLKKFKK